MGQTLNFAVNVDQSQIPAIFQQVQSGIAAQLQAGSLQLGNMTANVASMMNSMTAGGANPAASTMAYSMSPGTINHQLGKQPFIDRYSMMMDFTNQAYGIVANRAQSVISPAPFGPRIASYSQQMANSVVGGFGDAATGLAGWSLASKILPKAGFITQGLLFGGIQSVLKPMIGDKIASFGKHMTGVAGSYTPGTQEYFDKMGSMVAARDIGAMFMSMGPQKYATTQYGKAISPQQAAKFGSSFQDIMDDMTKRSGDLNFAKIAAGGAFGQRALQHIAMLDPAGREMISRGSSEIAYGGQMSGATNSRIREIMALHERKAIMAGAYGISDPKYAQIEFANKYGQMLPQYTGPNRWQMMGRDMGFKTGLGRGFGEEIMNRSVRFDASRDLGMSREQREMLGGKYQMGARYGAMIHQDAATFGGPMSIMYAGMMNTGAVPGDITQMAPAAAGVFSNPQSYWQYRLNYKDTMAKGGGKAAVAAHKRMVGLFTEHMMRTNPGAFKNTYEARRAYYETQRNMSPEEAAQAAAMDESVGMVIESKGSGKLSLADIWGSAAEGKLASMDADVLKSIGADRANIPEYIKNVKAFNRNQFINPDAFGETAAADVKYALNKYGTYEKALNGTSSATTKSALSALQKSGATIKAVLDAPNAEKILQTNLWAAAKQSVNAHRSEFVVGKKQAAAWKKIDKNVIKSILDAVASGNSDAAAQIARDNNIDTSVIDSLGKINKEDVNSTLEGIEAQKKSGKTTYIPKSDGGFGVYDQSKNVQEQISILKQLITVIQKQSDPTVRNLKK